MAIVIDATKVKVEVKQCSAWQIRKVLNQTALRQSVEDAVFAATDQDLKDGWEFAEVFLSTDPFVIAIGQAVGKTEAEVTALIELAATL